MLKKLLNVLLQILGCLLFIFAILTSGLLKFESSALYYFSFLIIPLLLLPIFPKDKRMNGHAVVVAALMLFEGASQVMERIRGDQQFEYELGYTSGPLRLAVQNESAQASMRDMLTKLPLRLQKQVINAEAQLRVLKIKEFVANDYETFKVIFMSTKEIAPLEMYQLGKQILEQNKLSTIEAKVNLFELSQAVELNAQYTPEQLFAEIDQLLASEKLTKSQAVALKLRIHKFNSGL
jgi:hypothetical protein